MRQIILSILSLDTQVTDKPHTVPLDYKGHDKLAIRGIKRPIRIVEMRLTLWLSNTCIPLIWRIPLPACSTTQPVRSSKPKKNKTFTFSVNMGSVSCSLLTNTFLHLACRDQGGKSITVVTKTIILTSFLEPYTYLPHINNLHCLHFPLKEMQKTKELQYYVF